MALDLANDGSSTNRLSAYLTQFTPICDGGGSPFCYLLEIDQSKILLDCGIEYLQERLSVDHLVPMRGICREIDAVVCTHSGLEHIGGLPYVYGVLGLGCPVYMSVAQSMMAQVTLLDTYGEYARPGESGSGVGFTRENVRKVLEKIIGVRYSQSISLSGKAEGIVVTAYPAGHSLGGCYWKIKKGNEDIVYAINFNHKKEKHLDGSSFINLPKPSVLITDCTSSLSVYVNRKLRDKEFVDTIVNNLNRQGNVLIPVDASGRVLEMLLLLESVWSSQHYTYPVYFVGPQSRRLFDFARSMLEWMSEGLSKMFTSSRENPFDFKHVFVHSLDSIEQIVSDDTPKVVFSTCSTLEYGPSRRFFYKWCSDPKNLVILTKTYPKGTLSHKLAFGEEISGFDVFIRKKSGKKDTASIQDNYLETFYDEDVDEDSHSIEDDEKTNDDFKRDGDKFDVILEKDQTTSFLFHFSHMAPPLRKKNSVYGEILTPSEWPRFSFVAGSPEEEDVICETINDALKSFGSNTDLADLEEYDGEDFDVLHCEGNATCKVVSIEFDGVCDGRSLQTLISKIHPRNLMLVHGNWCSMDYLHSFMKISGIETKSVSQSFVRTGISNLSNTVQMCLSDSLLSSLKMVKRGEYELCRITGVLKTSDVGDADAYVTVPTLEAPESGEDLTASLEMATKSVSNPFTAQRFSRLLLVGDLKFSIFRKVLQNKGYQARFDAGRLLVNEHISIHRDVDGNTVVWGPVSIDLYNIRSCLYSQLGGI